MVDLRKTWKNVDKRALAAGFLSCLALGMVLFGLNITNRFDLGFKTRRVSNFKEDDSWADRSFTERLKVKRGSYNESYAVGSLRSINYTETASSPVSTPDHTPIPRKIIRNANMDIIVSSPEQTATDLQQMVTELGGYVVHYERRQVENSSAAIDLRIPAEKLDVARERVRKAASKVSNENVSTDDVTARYVDVQAHLRNMRAEEQQYLDILKTAKSVEDVLAVREKISDVRDRIERTQGEFNVLEHDIAMSSLHVQINSESSAAEAKWEPWKNFRRSFREALGGLERYMNGVVALVLWLPILILWLLTLAIVLLVLWKTLAWGWRQASSFGWVGSGSERSEKKE